MPQGCLAIIFSNQIVAFFVNESWRSNQLKDMSYLVLARKWRPQNFEEVAGQDHVTRTLRNAIREGRLAHALLYSGPRGVGKTTVARIVAKAVNCEADHDKRPCNKCNVCLEISSGASVDVLEIDGASNRGIDEIRQLRENIYFRPTRCKSRIYIIDEVHMLTKEAFNALLKTLEEPPSHVIFQFATTEPNKVPATIKSRCQHFEFRRLDIAELSSHLGKIVEAEGLGLEQKAIKVLAREAMGSVRDSLSLLDQVAAYGARTIDEVCDALGVADVSQLETLVFAILDGDIPKALAVVKEIYGSGRDIVKFAEEFVRFFRDLCVLKAVGPQACHELTNLMSEDASGLYERCSNWSEEFFYQALDILLNGQEIVARSTFPRMAFEMVLIKLAIKRQVVPIDQILDKISRYKRGETASSGLAKSSGEYFEQTKEKTPQELSIPPSQDGISKVLEVDTTAAGKMDAKENWERFLEFVKQKRPSLAPVLACCEIKACNELEMVLSCSTGMNYDLLCDSDNQTRIKSLAREFWGSEISIKIDSSKCSVQNSDKSTKDIKTMKDDVVNSPLVQEALRIFEARIADVKPRFEKKK